MRALGILITVVVSLPIGAQTRGDPRITSIHPFTGQPGASFSALVRGANLAGASSVKTANAPFTIHVEGVEKESPSDNPGPRKNTVDLVRIRVDVLPDARPGRYPLRLIAANGISNALPLQVVDLPNQDEPPGDHDSPATAIAVNAAPTVFRGRLTRRGEVDFYSFHAAAGQTLTFDLISGFPQIAAGGSAATIPNFDPAITVYERSGSWFDPNRLRRIAYNDEPVWVFGKPTDPHLVHRFEKAGEYLLRVEAFAGQGGPDYSYALKITTGSQPLPESKGRAGWDERGWTRKLDSTRLTELAKRGGNDAPQPAAETYRASSETPLLKLPATVEGAITNPGQSQRARFHLEKPADIAIEIETPAAAPPYFNPIVRLLDAAGAEVASNVFAGRGACSGAMSKSMQAKTILPLRNTGDYTLEIREATADLAAPDFRYRMMVRPQIPHLGQVGMDADVVNLAPGEAKIIHVTFDREEDYRGAIMLSAEDLPQGISAAAAADYEADKDPPLTTGKRERYQPRTEHMAMVLTASPEAPVSKAPGEFRLVARPLVNGKPGAVLSVKTFPIMVIPKP